MIVVLHVLCRFCEHFFVIAVIFPVMSYTWSRSWTCVSSIVRSGLSGLQSSSFRARSTSSVLGGENSTTFTAKTFSLGSPPNPNEHFYIDTVTDVDDLIGSTENQDLILIRGPPASGKSTLAEAVRRRFPYSKGGDNNKRSFVLVPGQHLNYEDADSMGREIIRILNSEDNLDGDLPDVPNLESAFTWMIRRNIAVIVDEAHMIFRNDDKFAAIYSIFLNKKLNILLSLL